MTAGPSPDAAPESLAVLERFDVAWRSATPPRIDVFWTAVRPVLPAAQRPALLTELIKIDLEYRWRRSATRTEPLEVAGLDANAEGLLLLCPLLEDYAALLPDLPPVASWPPELIAEEYRVRHRWGNRPGHTEYAGRFPHGGAALADQLHRADAELGQELGHRPEHTVSVEQAPPAGTQLPLPPATLRTFGDYDLLEELGRGGMGVVYKAKQRRLERLVALKIIRPDRLEQTSTRQRFHREVRAAARLSHPNIVTIYDADEIDGVPFLAMEHVEGVNLMTLVQKRGPLAPTVARACARQAALGLQHIYERGLVHRDIKPSNLMLALSDRVLTESGDSMVWPDLEQPGLVKILDMGLARCFQLDPNDAGPTLTRDEALLGTPDYVSPEQAEDPRKADIRSDLYSLGCTLFYLLSGDVPFPGGTVMQKMDRHRWEATPLVRQHHPDVPAELAAIVARLMSKRPDARFQTPAELIVALEEEAQPQRHAASEAPAVTVERTVPMPGPPSPVPRRAPPAAVHAHDTIVSVTARLREAHRNTKPLRRITTHLDSVESVTFTPDGRRFVTASLDRTARIWDLQTGAELLLVDRHQGGVLCSAFTPNGRYLITGGRDRTIRAWSVSDGVEMRRLEGHAGDINSLTVTPDGRSVLSASSDRTMRLWDLDRGKEVLRFGAGPRDLHWSAVLYVAVAPDGKHALSGGRDRTLRLWDLTTGQEVHRFAEHSIAVFCVAVSPDGRYALSAGGTSLRMFDLHSAELVRRFKGHENSVMSVAFSADSRMIVSGGKDRSVRIWDVESGEPVERCETHTGKVMSVAFAPDGRHVLSGGTDKLACLWRLGG
jgi:WD40 repeat protein/tRNA A-37 threonylcarbamoyl transferase component Bud32